MKPTDDVSRFPENGMSTTPRTDAAYFKQGATMYDLAGESKKLETELTAMQARAEKAEDETLVWRNRFASILWTGALGKSTVRDFKKWEAEYKAERNALIARAEKAEADTARMDWLSNQQRIDYCTGYWLQSHLGQHPDRTLRATIDAAMK